MTKKTRISILILNTFIETGQVIHDLKYTWSARIGEGPIFGDKQTNPDTAFLLHKFARNHHTLSTNLQWMLGIRMTRLLTDLASGTATLGVF